MIVAAENAATDVYTLLADKSSIQPFIAVNAKYGISRIAIAVKRNSPALLSTGHTAKNKLCSAQSNSTAMVALATCDRVRQSRMGEPLAIRILYSAIQRSYCDLRRERLVSEIGRPA